MTRLGILLLLWWPLAAPAVTGNSLLNWCQQHLREESAAGDAATTSPGAACLSYLAGVVDTVTVGHAWKQWNVNVCVPANAKTDEIVKIYTAWALQHPDGLYHPAAASVARALHEAFPCR